MWSIRNWGCVKLCSVWECGIKQRRFWTNSQNSLEPSTPPLLQDCVIWCIVWLTPCTKSKPKFSFVNKLVMIITMFPSFHHSHYHYFFKISQGIPNVDCYILYLQIFSKKNFKNPSSWKIWYILVTRCSLADYLFMSINDGKLHSELDSNFKIINIYQTP